MKTKILVADDSTTMRMILKRGLEARGFSVLTAESAEDVMLLVQEFAPDMILMDVNMPGTDGIGAAFQLRSNPDTRHIPIVAMTGSPDPSLRDEALHLGCRGFIQKPFSIGELMEEIEPKLAALAA